MSDFGDFDADDAVDHEPPAPEQVAYKLHRLRQELEALSGHQLRSWDDLEPNEQALAMALAEDEVQWLASHAADPEMAARVMHEDRRMRSSDVPQWSELDADSRAVAVHLLAVIIEWLRRQGALA